MPKKSRTTRGQITASGFPTGSRVKGPNNSGKGKIATRQPRGFKGTYAKKP